MVRLKLNILSPFSFNLDMEGVTVRIRAAFRGETAPEARAIAVLP